MKQNGETEVIKLTEQQEKELALMTNIYYMILEGADSLLYVTEKYFETVGKGMKGKNKVQHRLLMSQFKTMKNLMDNELEHYKESFNGDWAKWDNLRTSGQYLLRINLLIGDRCHSDTDIEGERERRIERYIYNMPENGGLSEELYNLFKMK